MRTDAIVIISVTDVEDTPPYFERIQSYAEISEDAAIVMIALSPLI